MSKQSFETELNVISQMLSGVCDAAAVVVEAAWLNEVVSCRFFVIKSDFVVMLRPVFCIVCFILKIYTMRYSVQRLTSCPTRSVQIDVVAVSFWLAVNQVETGRWNLRVRGQTCQRSTTDDGDRHNTDGEERRKPPFYNNSFVPEDSVGGGKQPQYLK